MIAKYAQPLQQRLNVWSKFRHQGCTQLKRKRKNKNHVETIRILVAARTPPTVITPIPQKRLSQRTPPER
jgi:hypothetical protein